MRFNLAWAIWPTNWTTDWTIAFVGHKSFVWCRRICISFFASYIVFVFFSFVVTVQGNENLWAEIHFVSESLAWLPGCQAECCSDLDLDWFICKLINTIPNLQCHISRFVCALHSQAEQWPKWLNRRSLYRQPESLLAPNESVFPDPIFGRAIFGEESV